MGKHEDCERVSERESIMYTNFLLLYSRIGDSSEEDTRESETGNTEQVGRGEEVSLNIFPTLPGW